MEIAKPALIVYTLARRDAPSDATHAYLRRLWDACEQLGMTAPVPEVHPSSEFPADFGAPAPSFQPLAARIALQPRWKGAYYQAFLFGYYDVVGLIACLAPNVRNDELERWRALHREWWDKAWQKRLPDGILGEAYLFLALSEQPPQALPALSRAVSDALPCRAESQPPTPYLTGQGFCLWEGAPYEGRRVFALLAPETAEDALTAWTLWSGAHQLAPFARCLLHAAKIRYEEAVYLRDLPALHQQRELVDRALNTLLEQHAQLEGRAYVPLDALIEAQSQLSRAQADATGLLISLSRLKELRTTVQIAARNLQSLAPAPSPFDADLALAEWLQTQSEYDLDYLGAIRERAEEAYRLTQLCIEQAAQRTARRQNDLSLLQTTLLGALLTALTAIQALQVRLPLPESLHLPMTAFLAALALALPPLVLRWREPYQRMDYLFVALLGASAGWLGAAGMSLRSATLLPGWAEGVAAIVSGLLSWLLLRLLDHLQRREPMAPPTPLEHSPARLEPSRALSGASNSVLGASDAPSEPPSAVLGTSDAPLEKQ